MLLRCMGIGCWLFLSGCDKGLPQPSTPSGTSTHPGKSITNRLQATSAAPLDLRNQSMLKLRKIGIAYYQALAMGEGFFNSLVGGAPPTGLDDLLPYLDESRATLVSSRDGQPFVILWNIRPIQQRTGLQQTVLAWEATADAEGGRCVLFLSGFPAYVQAETFAKLPRASPEEP